MDPLRADVFLTSCRSYELACEMQTGGPGQNCTAATLMFIPIIEPGPTRGSPLAAISDFRFHLKGKGSDGGDRTGNKDLGRFKVRLRFFWGVFPGGFSRLSFISWFWLLSSSTDAISDAPALS